MDAQEFDEADKQLTERQKRLLSFLSMPGDGGKPLEERLLLVERRAKVLESKSLLEGRWLEGSMTAKELQEVARRLRSIKAKFLEDSNPDSAEEVERRARLRLVAKEAVRASFVMGEPPSKSIMFRPPEKKKPKEI